MNMTFSENMRMVYMKSENANDQYQLGRIAVNLKANVYPFNDATKGKQLELQADFDKVIEALAK